MKLTLVLGAMLLALSPAIAQDCQFPLDKTWADLEADGSKMVALLDVPGIGFDQILLYIKGDVLKLGPVSQGCMVAAPLALGEVQPGTAPLKTPGIGV